MAMVWVSLAGPTVASGRLVAAKMDSHMVNIHQLETRRVEVRRVKVHRVKVRIPEVRRVEVHRVIHWLPASSLDPVLVDLWVEVEAEVAVVVRVVTS